MRILPEEAGIEVATIFGPRGVLRATSLPFVIFMSVCKFSAYLIALLFIYVLQVIFKKRIGIVIKLDEIWHTAVARERCIIVGRAMDVVAPDQYIGDCYILILSERF